MIRLHPEPGSRSKSALSRFARSLRRWASRRPAPIPYQLDILYGSRAIARFLGLPKATTRGLIVAGTLPTFKLGTVDCALRSSLFDHLKTLEERHGERS